MGDYASIMRIEYILCDWNIFFLYCLAPNNSIMLETQKLRGLVIEVMKIPSEFDNMDNRFLYLNLVKNGEPDIMVLASRWNTLKKIFVQISYCTR